MTLEEKLQEFANYRKAIKKPIRKESFEAFMRKLIKLGNGNEETMIEILDCSIANGWQGIFELKNNLVKISSVDGTIQAYNQVMKSLENQ